MGLGVEGSGGGIRLVGVDGHSRVAIGLEERAPWLVGLVPVAGGLGVVHGVRVVAEEVDGGEDHPERSKSVREILLHGRLMHHSQRIIKTE